MKSFSLIISQKRVLMQILTVLCFAFVIDNALLGGGDLLSIGPFSVRNYLAIFIVLLELLLIYPRKRSILLSSDALWLLVFLVLVLLSGTIGYKNGNNLSIIRSDLVGFSYLLLYPAFLMVFEEEVYLKRLLSCVYIVTSVLSGLSIIVQVSFALAPSSLSGPLYSFISKFEIGMIDNVTGNTFRVFMKSMPFCFVSIVYGLQQVRSSVKNRRLSHIAIVSVHLVSLIFTFTRSIYLGLLATVIGFVVYSLPLNSPKRLMFIVIQVSSVAVVFTLGLSLLTGGSYFEFALKRSISFVRSDNTSRNAEIPGSQSLENTSIFKKAPILVNDGASTQTQVGVLPIEHSPEVQTTHYAGFQSEKNVHELNSAPYETGTPSGDAIPEVSDSGALKNSGNIDEYQSSKTYIDRTVASDSIRWTSIKELTQAFLHKPIFGNGLGFEAPSRSLQEFFYLDLAAKMGIVGITAYALPFLYVLVRHWRSAKPQQSLNSGFPFACGLFGVVVTSFFNPYLNSSIGITILLIALVSSRKGISIKAK